MQYCNFFIGAPRLWRFVELAPGLPDCLLFAGSSNRRCDLGAGANCRLIRPLVFSLRDCAVRSSVIGDRTLVLLCASF